ncbi:hypothetical protein [Streptomyces sp. N2A]|uniref:hypothetical protein n=1 Tax=Streptomyces sp. N2A TaxID=3073936 RepID=UPI002870A121|nr:hypothetical protein [Streptomyces sp. N2A]
MGERLGAAGTPAIGALAGLTIPVLDGGGETVRPAGVAYVLLSAAGCAAMTLVTRRLGRGGDSDPYASMNGAFVAGCGLSAAARGGGGLWPQAHDLARSLWLTGYMAAVPTALGYVLNFAGPAPYARRSPR